MAKVEEVHGNEVRKKKSKNSKSKKSKTKKTAPKQVEPQRVVPSPNTYVQQCKLAEEATPNESGEQSQFRCNFGRRRRGKRENRLTIKSQPSKISYSHPVKIAKLLKLAHEAVGSTATTKHTEHLRRSISSGISAGLKEAQVTGTPKNLIEQKLRNKVLEHINRKSPYSRIKQILVTLDNFMQALHVQAATALQPAAGQDQDQYWRASEPAFAGFAPQTSCVVPRNKMSNGEQRRSSMSNEATRAEKLELSPREEQAKAQEREQNGGFEFGQARCRQPCDRKGQLNENTTFYRDVILTVRNRNILVHLKAMNKEDFLSIVNSAFHRVSPHSNSKRALRWLSHATITDSGNVKASVHTKDPDELDTLTEEMTTGWARTLQNEAEQSSSVFEILVPNFPIDPTNLDDPDHKAEIVDRLVRNNAARIPSLNTPDDIYDVQIAGSNEQANRAALILIFKSCQLANDVYQNGLDWNGEHHRCEALEAGELLERCERCQLFTHSTNSCTNAVRCGKCGDAHFTRLCKSIDFACAVCPGPHPAYSEACPTRNSARNEIQEIHFAPDSEEDHPQLTTSCTQHEKSLCKAVGLEGIISMKEARPTSSHPHCKEVLEKMRRLRQEVIALEKELTSRLQSRDQRTASIGVPGKTLKSRSNISGRVQQAAAIGGLPAPSNGKREPRKRKAEGDITDHVEPEVAFDKKRIKREESAFDEFGYQWTPGYHGPRE